MSLSQQQRREIASVPTRPLEGLFFRQTDPGRQPLDLRPRATRAARWHLPGEPSPVYAASNKLGSMLELSRHTVAPADETETVLPERLMSELHVVELPVLDLTNRLLLDVLGLEPEDLTANDPALCQEIATLARQRDDVEGLLVPSAALEGTQTLVIEQRGLHHVAVGTQGLVALKIVPAKHGGSP